MDFVYGLIIGCVGGPLAWEILKVVYYKLKHKSTIR